jgi:ABC-type lipoprotein export system ATPase subunit
MKLLKELHKEAKNTIILITHDKNVAKYADTTYELNKNSLDII